MAQRYTSPFPGVIASHRKHPAAIGWEERLYDFPAMDKKTLDFETLLFKRIDQHASDLFTKLKNSPNPILSKRETETLAVFLLTLMHRSPAGIAAMRQLSKMLFEEVRAEIRDTYNTTRSEIEPLTVEDYEAQQGPDAYLDHFSNIFRSVVFSEKIAAFLANLHWKRVKLEAPDRRLLLSDDPLIRTNGLAGPEGHVAFPLSPKFAIIGCNQSQYFDKIFSQSPRILIGKFNEQTVQSARHFVVGVDEQQDRFVRNRFGKSQRPTLSEQSLNDRTNGNSF
ncbi:hypothetical protein MTsPCn3_24540 [Erythrobacter sp. MTPC3]